METTRALMPRARQDELIVEELQDETLVYDLQRHKARCLNRTAALVATLAVAGCTVDISTVGDEAAEEPAAVSVKSAAIPDPARLMKLPAE